MLKLESLLIGILSIVALLIFLLLANPEWKKAAQNFLTPQERIVLAKLDSSLGTDITTRQSFPLVTVIKLKDKTDILVEIYKHQQDELVKWIDFRFENEKDGYLTQGAKTTNLSMSDLDRNGVFEIIAPGVDQQMNPRVHIIEYQPELNSFRLKMAPGFPDAKSE